ncbi:hypothetical protein GCM10020219_036770 [Nonomuraea dietziae]
MGVGSGLRWLPSAIGQPYCTAATASAATSSRARISATHGVTGLRRLAGGTAVGGWLRYRCSLMGCCTGPGCPPDAGYWSGMECRLGTAC